MLATRTIAARLTAEIPAALATIAIEGPAAADCVRTHTGLSASQMSIGRIRFATWLCSIEATSDRQQVGEQVVVCRTQDQRVEVHCHGGKAVCQAILHDLERFGCTIVSQSDWPSQFACPIALAAEQDLLQTTTDRAAATLLDQMSGALSRSITEILEHMRAGQFESAETNLQLLLSWSDFGLHLAHPWRVVLAGPPNVGKSSLLNAIVGRQQTIVHAEPGTTRDWIESATAIEGWPVAFTDTAGVRNSSDAIEVEGVARGISRLQQADLTVLVVDASVGWTEVHNQLLSLATSRKIIAWNKSDIAQVRAGISSGRTERVAQVLTCALGDSPGVAPLLAAIHQLLIPAIPQVGTAIPFRKEQVLNLQTALRLLRDQQPMEAVVKLRALLPSWNG